MLETYDALRRTQLLQQDIARESQAAKRDARRIPPPLGPLAVGPSAADHRLADSLLDRLVAIVLPLRSPILVPNRD